MIVNSKFHNFCKFDWTERYNAYNKTNNGIVVHINAIVISFEAPPELRTGDLPHFPQQLTIFVELSVRVYNTDDVVQV
jgi:hypothetical protein